MPESSQTDKMPPKQSSDPAVPRLMKPKEVAEMLGTTPRNVSALASKGHLTRIVLGNRSTRYELEDVKRFIRERRNVEGPV